MRHRYRLIWRTIMEEIVRLHKMVAGHEIVKKRSLISTVILNCYRQTKYTRLNLTTLAKQCTVNKNLKVT